MSPSVNHPLFMANPTTAPAAHLVLITVRSGCDDFGHDTHEVISMREVAHADVPTAWASIEDACDTLTDYEREHDCLTVYVEGVTDADGSWTTVPNYTDTNLLAAQAIAA